MSDYDYVSDIDSRAEGTVFGASTTALIGFWGATPVDQGAALTVALTTMTCSAVSPCSASATIDLTVCGAGVGFGFASSAQLYTFGLVIVNCQTRLAEIEARLEDLGIVAAN